MSLATTNKIIVLKKWLKHEVVKATFTKSHNGGQYPWRLETKDGIKCIRHEYPNPNGGRPIVGREMVFDDENIERVESLLMRLGGRIPSRKDEVKES